MNRPPQSVRLWPPRGARNALGGCALLALAACAGPALPQWEHPERPVEQWTADIRACQALANREAERQFRQDSRVTADRGDLGGDRLSARLDALGAERERSRILDSCLTQQGYRRAGQGKR